MARYLRPLFVLPFLIFGPLVFSAQNVFVIGSYKSSKAAHAEASRITKKLDAELIIEEILIDSVLYHRLMLPYPMDPGFEKELSQELVSLGIKDIWRSRIDLNEVERRHQLGNQIKTKVWSRAEDDWKTQNLVAPENQIYKVVAGSFIQEVKAEEFAEELRNWGEESKIEDTDIVGELYYRVVLGPLLQSDALLTKKRLEALGVISPWLVLYEDTVSGPRSVKLEEQALDTLEFDSASIKKEKTESPVESVFSEFADTEYNLAKLKKK